MKKVVRKILPKASNASVKNHKILDPTLIASEVIDFRLKRLRSGGSL